jgi:N-acetylmuramic acid 6-phosphate etherase
VEGAEDSRELAEEDLRALGLTGKDFVVGLAASGRTPYVHGALEYAKKMGCATALITCSAVPPSEAIDIMIFADTGPEAVTGSTRMKAGTAQKMVLNMISTGTMIRLGKVYGNLMVDLRPTNVKLVDRACRIIMEVADCAYETAKTALNEADGQVKTAVLMVLKDMNAEEAREKLVEYGGRLGEVLAAGKKCDIYCG